MKGEFNLSEYMSNEVENVIKGVIKASFKNPKETAFILKYALTSREAKKRRDSFKNTGEKPAFLIK